LEGAIQRAVVRTIDREMRGAGPTEPLADPGALALTAFATTAFMLGLYLSGLVGTGSLPLVFPVALLFGGLIQIMVAMLEVVRGNTFGGAAFGTYGAFWVIFGAINTWFVHMVKPASAVDAGVAVFLSMFAVVSFYFLLASLKTDLVIFGIFLLLVPAFSVIAYGYANADPTGTLVKIGGWLNMAFAVLGWYHAAADLIAQTFGRQVLPVGPLSE
jgi:succinate-acetate transporter protein